MEVVGGFPDGGPGCPKSTSTRPSRNEDAMAKASSGVRRRSESSRGICFRGARVNLSFRAQEENGEHGRPFHGQGREENRDV